VISWEKRKGPRLKKRNLADPEEMPGFEEGGELDED
jgi:hypothetical protein